MAFPDSEAGRVNRAKYWQMFFVTLVATIVLVGISITALANLEIGIAIVAFLLIVPVNLYFRVIMMRRCRDIGWPAALPWIAFGLGIAASVFNIGSMDAKDPTALMGGSGFSMLVSLGDFALMIVLGCIKGRDQIDYRDVFDGYGSDSRGPAMPRSAPRSDKELNGSMGGGINAPRPSVATGDSDAMDDAIARALDNYRRTGSATAQPVTDIAGSPLATRNPAARSGGFGRKVV